MGLKTARPAGYRFTASITKGAKKMTLTGTATSQISVSGIRVNPANVEWDSSLYRGPAFHELDPDLQVSGPRNGFRGGFELSCSLVVRVPIARATVMVHEREPKGRLALLYFWVRREQTNGG